MAKRRKTKEARPQRLSSSPATHDSSCAVADGPHQIEQDVQRYLLAHPELCFSSLVVRRVRNGVCLEGVVEASHSSPDVAGLAQRVAGVESVLNHLVVQRASAAQ